MKTKKMALLLGFIDNFLSTMRTAGALMAGNSLLVSFGVFGLRGIDYVSIGIYGIVCALLGSIPAERIFNFFKE